MMVMILDCKTKQIPNITIDSKPDVALSISGSIIDLDVKFPNVPGQQFMNANGGKILSKANWASSVDGPRDLREESAIGSVEYTTLSSASGAENTG